MSQNEIIINHIRRAKSISQREALIDHGIQSLTKRISELRSMGYKIKTVHKKHPITGQRYARYVMGR
jgi:hypothetical protein